MRKTTFAQSHIQQHVSEEYDLNLKAWATNSQSPRICSSVIVGIAVAGGKRLAASAEVHAAPSCLQSGEAPATKQRMLQDKTRIIGCKV